MKKQILILGFLASTTIGFGQIYTPGGTIAGNSGNTNVGIGVAVPGEKLDVSGNVRLGGSHLVFNSQFGVIDWGAGGTGDLIFRTLSTQGNINTYTDRLTMTNNGRMILGTDPSMIYPPSPSNDQLYIRTTNYTGVTIDQYSSTLRSALSLNNLSGGRSYQLGSTGNGDAIGTGKFVIRDVYGSSDRFVINSSGYTGIGTTNPDKLLTLNGELGFFRTVNPTSSSAGYIKYTNGFIMGNSSVSDPLSFQTNSIDRLYIQNDGKIGLGTNTPGAMLHLKLPSTLTGYGMLIEQTNTAAGFVQTIRAKNNNTKAVHVENSVGTIIESFKVMGDGRTKIGLSNTDPQALLHLYTPNSTGYNLFIEQNTTGGGGIGQTTRVKSNNTKAIVVENAVGTIVDVFRVMGDGKVWATEVNVQLTPFPDYVFAKEYKLMDLSSLESYINENHHLPNVPSAKEVESNGANLGELSKIQMEKIEELTLYIIELKKEVESMKTKIDSKK